MMEGGRVYGEDGEKPTLLLAIAGIEVLSNTLGKK
jgi:hypothetical protein